MAELIYATSPKLHDRFVGGKAQSLVMLTTAFASPGNNVSAEVVHVAELNGGVAGAMACFPVDQARRRGRAVLRVALGCTPLHRWPAALSIYLRGGQMTARPPARSLYVDSIATDERLRRRGVARALLARADELARSQGLLRIALDTDAGEHARPPPLRELGLHRRRRDTAARRPAGLRELRQDAVSDHRRGTPFVPPYSPSTFMTSRFFLRPSNSV